MHDDTNPRLQRLVERLLEEADEATRTGDWPRVCELAEYALTAVPGSPEVEAYIRIAERQLAHAKSLAAVGLRPEAIGHQGGDLPKSASRSDTRKFVGQHLRSIRRSSGRTQTEIAHRAGITQAALSNYERGKRELPLSTLINLADALDLDLKQLFDLPEIRRYVERELSARGTARYDVSTERIEISEALRHILGVEAEAPLDKIEALLELIHPQDRTRGRLWFQELLSGAPTGPCQLRAVRGDGALCYLEGYGRIQVDLNDRVVGCVVTLHDVTERRKAEEELLESYEHLARAQDIARVASWEMDIASGQVRGSGRVPGLPAESSGAPRRIPWDDFNRASYLDMVHPEDRDRVGEALERVRADGTPVSHEYRIVHPDGSVHVMRTHSEVVLDKSGDVVKIIGTTQDVTELAGARASLEALNQVARWLVKRLHPAWIVADANDNIARISPETAALVGWPPTDLIGRPMASLFEMPDDPSDAAGGVIRPDVILRTAGGGAARASVAILTGEHSLGTGSRLLIVVPSDNTPDRE